MTNNNQCIDSFHQAGYPTCPVCDTSEWQKKGIKEPFVSQADGLDIIKAIKELDERLSALEQKERK